MTDEADKPVRDEPVHDEPLSGEPGQAPRRTGATRSEDALSEEQQVEQSVAAERKEWWDDPRLPWKGEPTAADKRCWIAFALLGVYGLVMLPLRPLILGMSTYALAIITGSTIAMVDIGAGLRLGGEPQWWMWVTIAALSVMKFDWIFWWAGRLWGRGMIEIIAGRSRWAARTAHHAERLAERFGGIATYLVWLIPFLPSAVVFAFVGAARMRLRTFLIIDFLGALTNRLFYFYLGYRIGEPAKDAVSLIARYSTYITIAIVVLIMIKSMRDSRKETQAQA